MHLQSHEVGERCCPWKTDGVTEEEEGRSWSEGRMMKRGVAVMTEG